ncbi:MAG: ABC transporter ATP-binding protein [Oscillospiraceae bacterium]|nr:ABC transporter ATP-binding protein [Oscillospiraceae bacterium]
MRESTDHEGKLDLRLWLRLGPYVKKVRRPLIISIVLLAVSSLAEAAYPLFTSYAVNTFVVPGVTRGIGLFALVYALIILAGGVAVAFYSRSSMVVELTTGKLLKRACFVHLQELPISFYSTTPVGYLLSRVMSDTDRISSMISWGIIHMLWNLCYIIGAVVFMFLLKPSLAAILILVIPITAVITWIFEKKILVENRKMRAFNSMITGAYNEGITGAKASKTLVIEEDNCASFGVLTGKMYRASVRTAMLRGFLLPLILFCGSLAVAAVLKRGGHQVMVGGMDLGVMSAFISYAVGIIEPVVEIAGVITDIMAAQVCIERVTALLDEPCLIEDTAEVKEKYGDSFEPKTENWEPIRGDVTFDHVWFKYPDGGDWVLEDFSLHIPAGTTVAIVGETGAGKSTLVNLACRFYEPTEGRVLIDGRDSRERSQLWLHSSLGCVLQDPHLFSGTIAENIRYGRLEAEEEDVIRAARLVSADQVAARLPDGYKTEVGEGGDRLSTGEKQLISFARAMIADPPIFVLDEATSSIDTETEQLIQNAISRVLTGRTAFIIAHRLSTIRQADLIIVVDDGRIVEQGTHGELMAAGGAYAALYEAMRIKEEDEEVFDGR